MEDRGAAPRPANLYLQSSILSSHSKSAAPRHESPTSTPAFFSNSFFLLALSTTTIFPVAGS